MSRLDKRRSGGRVSVGVLRLPELRKPLWVVLVTVLLVLITPYLIAPFYAFGQPVSTVMLWREALGKPVERIFVPLSAIDPDVARAVIVAEDGRFCSHYGVDFHQIQNAIEDADSLEDMRGGSTITQQLAKNLFLWQSRSYIRKALEFPLALWIDLVLSKRRILELYLNVVEWGPSGQFGVEAGARYAFGRSARHLSPAQAALLAAVLPNPHERNARRPDGGLRRLERLYIARAARAPTTITACLRRH